MTNQQLINIAKDTIKTEIEGLQLLSQTIDDNFSAAITLISSIKGKVILSGVGKSGHVASKIAATLASTGTPSFFVHPTEALHGDLGMISKNDCVIIISNSGNSSELLGILDYCLKYSIPTIAITNNKNSPLAKSSTIFLQLPKLQEACPFNKAPTSSTTATMVLGDCLAVALLKLKNFTAEDFKSFHPGGSLGTSLKKLQDIMHPVPELPLIPNGSSMKEALLTITSKRFGCAGIVDENGILIGIITDGDLRRHLNSNLLDLTVEEVMTKSFISLTKDHLVGEALSLMHKNKITNMFILNPKQQPIGIVHIHDLTL